MFIDWDISDLKAQPFLKIAAGVEHGRVLYAHSDNMLSPIGVRQRRADYSVVIALAPATGENDLIQSGTDKGRHPLAGSFHRFFSWLPIGMSG
jgi:hypothetical protein